MLFRYSFILSFMIVLLGCGWFREPGTPLAKVKNQTLTLEELTWSGESRRDSMIQRVQSWVDDEILYQEALSAGVPKDQEVMWLLHDAERKIVLDAYQRRLTKSMADPEEGELEAYFDAHRAQFVQNEARMRYRTWFFPSLQAAKDSFRLMSNDSLDSTADSLLWVSSSQTGACLGGILATLRPGDVSIPQVCDNKYIVLKLYGRKPVGEPLSFQEARAEILDNVRKSRKSKMIDSLLLEAKSRQAVFTWPENLPNP